MASSGDCVASGCWTLQSAHSASQSVSLPVAGLVKTGYCTLCTVSATTMRNPNQTLRIFGLEGSVSQCEIDGSKKNYLGQCNF